MSKVKTIIITDGDKTAKETLEYVAEHLGLRCISSSWGNPTPLTGEEILSQLKKAGEGPVLVMVDDKGASGKGQGESVLETICKDENIHVMGVLAVASHTDGIDGVPVKVSVTKEGAIIDGPVDKFGTPEVSGHVRVEGDTVDILNNLDVPIIVGIGDIGKMDGADEASKGAPITTKAIEFILKESGNSQ